MKQIENREQAISFLKSFEKARVPDCCLFLVQLITYYKDKFRHNSRMDDLVRYSDDKIEVAGIGYFKIYLSWHRLETTHPSILDFQRLCEININSSYGTGMSNPIIIIDSILYSGVSDIQEGNVSKHISFSSHADYTIPGNWSDFRKGTAKDIVKLSRNLRSIGL